MDRYSAAVVIMAAYLVLLIFSLGIGIPFLMNTQKDGAIVLAALWLVAMTAAPFFISRLIAVFPEEKNDED